MAGKKLFMFKSTGRALLEAPLSSVGERGGSRRFTSRMLTVL